MHRFPKFFNSHNNNNKKMKSKSNSKSQPTTPTQPEPKPKPKLTRRNAAKNIHYDPDPNPSPSGSADSPDDSVTIRTRSIDVYPWGDRTSFRINGKEEGELDFICKSLGLNGPDDFGIQPDDYRVMKARYPQLSTQLEENYDTSVTLGIDRSRSDGVNVDDYRVMKARYAQLSSQFSNFVNIGGVEVEGDDGVLVDARGGSVVLGIDPSRSDGGNASVDDVLGKVSTFVNVNGVEVEGDARISSVILGVDRSRGGSVNASVDDVSGQVSTFVNVSGLDVEGDARVSSVILGIDRSRRDGVKLYDGVLGNGRLCSGVVDDVVSGLSDCNGVKMGLSRERVGVGIKGERPPAVLLTPPPRMALPVIDDVGSSWDILRSFGPENESISRIEDDQGESSSEDEGHHSAQEDVIEGDDDGVTRETIVGQGRSLISDSCSFTSNSNDDSSSTTTEPTSISPNGRLIRPISSWVKGRHLGSGSYGSVYEGYADGGFFFAVKEVSLLDQGDRGREIIYQLEQEMDFLSQFEHINIVRYLGTDKDDSNLYIFLELLPQGSLLSLYQRFCFQDSHVSGYTRQILEGLKYLHERNVVHRDIKCANILLGVNGIVKLADFGLAKVDKLNDAKSCKGTSYWMAPEVVKPNQRYGRPADIWSLGCTVLEMLTQKFPYHPLEGVSKKTIFTNSCFLCFCSLPMISTLLEIFVSRDKC
ncbi:hypothetical protein Leryth_009220 [Lithospermum erythrorhizon]|nr:hypothetical protein Leryth_009220 [Lithospermum erythrorhizon]